MCGIAVAIDWPDAELTVRLLISGILHRGDVTDPVVTPRPDSALATRRLRIVDAEHAVQPQISCNGRLVVSFNDQVIAVAIGLMVLLAVVVTGRSIDVPVTPYSLVAAGVVAGVSGTATSIGGPPIALLFQRRDPEVVRSTLAVFFFLGVCVSLVGLALSGALTAASWHLGLLLAPLVWIGSKAGALARPRLPRHAFRTGVLVICAGSAVALLAQSLT